MKSSNGTTETRLVEPIEAAKEEIQKCIARKYERFDEDGP